MRYHLLYMFQMMELSNFICVFEELNRSVFSMNKWEEKKVWYFYKYIFKNQN